MKIRILIVSLLFCAATWGAEDPAVASLHYEVAVEGQYLEYEFDAGAARENGQTVEGALLGKLTFPLGHYMGGFARASFDKGASEQYDGDVETESESLYGAAGLFFRNPQIGRIALGYERERIESSVTLYGGSEYDSTETSTFHGYLALAEGYVGPVTLRASDRRVFDDTETDDQYKDVVFASVDWYVSSNVRLGMYVGFDDAKGGYVAEIEFQPSFLSNMGGINIQYLRSEESEDDFALNGVRLGFKFYFDKRFDLVTRDRRYR